MLGIEVIKSVPHTPSSHPFIERLIGTIRREYLDQTLFWGEDDLERKLKEFAAYYNEHRVHFAFADGMRPAEKRLALLAKSARAMRGRDKLSEFSGC